MKLLRIVVFICLFLLATVMLLREIGVDSDIWLHIKTGQVILQNHKIPATDIFSFTAAGAKWINHEWLFQVIVASLYDFFGPNGVIFLRWFVIILTLFLILKVGAKRNNAVLTGIIALIFLVLIQTRLNDRPEIFSLLFIALFIYLLEEKLNSLYIWFLIPLQILWANMHAYFTIGPFIALAYLLEAAIKRQKSLKRLTALFLAAIAAGLINPKGFWGLLYPFRQALGIKTDLRMFTYYINELLGPFGINATGSLAVQLNLYKALIVITVALFLLNIKKLRICHLILYTGALLISSISIRNIPIFGIVACMTAMPNIERFKLKKNLEVLIGIPLIILTAVLFLNEALSAYYVYDEGFVKSRLLGVSPTRYPAGACSFLAENRIKGNILNNFYCGSYIIFRLYPDIKVTIDGRVAEIYSPQFYKSYRNALEEPSANLSNFIDKHNITCALFFEPSQQLAGAIRWFYNNWNLVYLDDTSVIFLKNDINNRNIASKHKIDLPKARLFQKIDFYPYGHINKARIFAYIGLYDKAEEETMAALEIDKKCIQAYNLLGGLYTMQGKIQEATETYKQAIKIQPRNESIYYNLGVLYDSAGKTDEAIEYFNKAIKINPLLQNSRFGLAVTLEKKGDLEGAKKQLFTIKDKDLSGDINCQLGYIYIKEKNWQKAKEALDAAVKINPKNARAYNGLGIVYGRLNESEGAIDAFREAVKISPRFKEAYDNMATTYANRGEYGKAIENWQKALDIDPTSYTIKDKIEKAKNYIYNANNLK